MSGTGGAGIWDCSAIVCVASCVFANDGTSNAIIPLDCVSTKAILQNDTPGAGWCGRSGFAHLQNTFHFIEFARIRIQFNKFVVNGVCMRCEHYMHRVCGILYWIRE